MDTSIWRDIGLEIVLGICVVFTDVVTRILLCCLVFCREDVAFLFFVFCLNYWLWQSTQRLRYLVRMPVVYPSSRAQTIGIHVLHKRWHFGISHQCCWELLHRWGCCIYELVGKKPWLTIWFSCSRLVPSSWTMGTVIDRIMYRQIRSAVIFRP